MARLNPVPLVRGHVRGLSSRTYEKGELVSFRPDWAARAASLLVPAATWCLIANARPTYSENLFNLLGIALAWAALASAGLLSTFTLLAGWRGRLAEAILLKERWSREAPLRALVDEAVAHSMLGVVESLSVAVLAGLACIVAVPWQGLLWAVTAAVVAHTVFLFGLIATRLYSAYVQAEDVPPEVDGFDRSSITVADKA
ncbi:MAG: hypothetical protein QM582_00170 [Micropruina sp.]|uniref:hypothetical protein n=1 Tax=Micropruina sp. TaxID=2737536 RepID=UPI0039E2AD53